MIIRTLINIRRANMRIIGKIQRITIKIIMRRRILRIIIIQRIIMLRRIRRKPIIQIITRMTIRIETTMQQQRQRIRRTQGIQLRIKIRRRRIIRRSIKGITLRRDTTN